MRWQRDRVTSEEFIFLWRDTKTHEKGDTHKLAPLVSGPFLVTDENTHIVVIKYNDESQKRVLRDRSLRAPHSDTFDSTPVIRLLKNEELTPAQYSSSTVFADLFNKVGETPNATGVIKHGRAALTRLNAGSLASCALDGPKRTASGDQNDDYNEAHVDDPRTPQPEEKTITRD